METLSAYLALCEGNSPVTGEFPSQRPVTRSFHIFFDMCLNKRLNEKSWGWLFETPSRPLSRYCNGFRDDILTKFGTIYRTSDQVTHYIAHPQLSKIPTKLFPLSVYKIKTAFNMRYVRAVCKISNNLQRITEDVSHHMCVLSSEHPPQYNCSNFYLRPSSFMNGPAHLSVYSSVHPSVCVCVRRTFSEISLQHQKPGIISAKYYDFAVSDALVAWQCV